MPLLLTWNTMCTLSFTRVCAILLLCMCRVCQLGGAFVCAGVTLRFTPAYGLAPLRGWVIGVARPYGAIFAGAKIQLFLR